MSLMLGSSSLMASRLVVGDQTARALCEAALLLVRSAVPSWAVLTSFNLTRILYRILNVFSCAGCILEEYKNAKCILVYSCCILHVFLWWCTTSDDSS